MRNSIKLEICIERLYMSKIIAFDSRGSCSIRNVCIISSSNVYACVK